MKLIAKIFSVLGLALCTPAFAASQVYSGDLVQIAVGDGGSLSIGDSCVGTAPVDQSGSPWQPDVCGIHVKKPALSGVSDPYVVQYLGWGSGLHFTAGGTTSKFKTPNLYSSGSVEMTPVSNTKAEGVGGGSVTSVADAGASGLRWTQIISHVAGTRYVAKRWVVENTSATTYTDLKFLHGGDTYFGGEDTAYGFYDAGTGAVYLKNSAYLDWGVMRFVGTPASPADRYFEGNYSDVYSGLSSGLLPNTVLSSFHDAGYALQWNRASLAPGESWTIEAQEGWSDAGSLQVLAPAPQNVFPGATVDLTFTLQNLDIDPASAALSALSTAAGWTASLQTSTPQAVAANGSVNVVVRVAIPAGALPGESSAITLVANDGTTDFSASVTLTAQAVPANDSDGIPDAVEDGVPNGSGTGTGDGNGDTIADSTQDSVTSVPAGAGGGYLTIESLSGKNISAVNNSPVLPGSLPAGATAPYGGFGFTASGAANGATEMFKLYVPYNPAITGALKWNRLTNAWDSIGTVSNMGTFKTVISFSLADGGPYDSDGAANGTIVDPIVPIVLGVAAAAAAPIPTLSDWGLLLMSVLLAGVAFVSIRRTRLRLRV